MKQNCILLKNIKLFQKVLKSNSPLLLYFSQTSFQQYRNQWIFCLTRYQVLRNRFSFWVHSHWHLNRSIPQNPFFHDITKHIEVCHFVSDDIILGDISPSFIPISEQLADIFIKALKKQQYSFLLIRKLDIRDLHAPTWGRYYDYCIYLLYICFYLVIFHKIWLVILGRYWLY